MHSAWLGRHGDQPALGADGQAAGTASAEVQRTFDRESAQQGAGPGTEEIEGRIVRDGHDQIAGSTSVRTIQYRGLDPLEGRHHNPVAVGRD